MKASALSLDSFGILGAACAATLLGIAVMMQPILLEAQSIRTRPRLSNGMAPPSARGGTDETTAIEGVNRDTLILHVAAGNYTGKSIGVKSSGPPAVTITISHP